MLAEMDRQMHGEVATRMVSNRGSGSRVSGGVGGEERSVETAAARHNRQHTEERYGALARDWLS